MPFPIDFFPIKCARWHAGQKCVLGLATGSTPTPVYRELVKMHKDGILSFKNVVTFNLDEYYGLHQDDLQSYHKYMARPLTCSSAHADVELQNIRYRFN